jgi:hypothetical protein
MKVAAVLGGAEEPNRAFDSCAGVPFGPQAHVPQKQAPVSDPTGDHAAPENRSHRRSSTTPLGEVCNEQNRGTAAIIPEKVIPITPVAREKFHFALCSFEPRP